MTTIQISEYSEKKIRALMELFDMPTEDDAIQYLCEEYQAHKK